MRRKVAVLLAMCMSLAILPGAALAADPTYGPGAPGIGDPYFPLDGNGGYQVTHYLLDVRYDPDTDVLKGKATIKARTTRNLTSFNLDFVGLTVRSIKVNGKSATWTRDAGELTVAPRDRLHRKKDFTVVVRYDGVPETINDLFGVSGFLHTDDGALIIGQPHVAATWFPANDHPIDKARYIFTITVPRGLEAIANGVLKSKDRHGAWTTWTWDARDPMATYLAGVGIGQFDIDKYRDGRIAFWDAIDPRLTAPLAAPNGTRFAYSGGDDLAYKRLTQTVTIPPGDTSARLSFQTTFDTEEAFDYFFVEARDAESGDRTTLPDLNGNNNQGVGGCPYILPNHPSLAAYLAQVEMTDDEGNTFFTCEPVGSGLSGDWWAVTGKSEGPQDWSLDLSGYAGGAVDLSISFASDDSVIFPGVFIDDIVMTTSAGTQTTDFEDGTTGGWDVPGAPAGDNQPVERGDVIVPIGPPISNASDWRVITAAEVPPNVIGANAQASFARQPEILDALGGWFGKYPFKTSGGIVDFEPNLGFALETQTRPIYSMAFFGDPIGGDLVVVHELAHQWFGDSLAVKRWQHIWLNEGFATYAEWLWLEQQGIDTVQNQFDFWYNEVFRDPADPFWDLPIGDPGPDAMFDFAVYTRGAMTLHQLRLTVGDDDFFKILQRWFRIQKGGHVTTDEFIRTAERVSGQQLDDLFASWLFETDKPGAIFPAGLRRQTQAQGSSSRIDLRKMPAARSLLQRYGKGIDIDRR